MIEVDLHLHTTFSDGRLTPTELVGLCHERGLKVICISDHDTTNGLPVESSISIITLLKLTPTSRLPIRAFCPRVQALSAILVWLGR